jgi:drug/metabolite transporter (DMT)-like permease
MQTNKVKSLILLLALSFIWGSSFILIKKGLVSFSALEVGALRIFISALIFLPFLLLQFKRIPWNKSGYMILFGALEIGFPPFLYSIAQLKVDSSTAGILNSLVPLFTLLAGMFFFRIRFGFFKFLGVMTGLIGAILLVMQDSSGHISIENLDFTNVYGLLIVVATLFYGIANNVLKEHLQNIPSRLIMTVSFLTMGVFATFILIHQGFFLKPILSEAYFNSFVAVFLLSAFGSALAMMLFTKLVQLSNALFASFVTYLIPFFAMMWGALDGESITLLQIFSLLFIFAGIYLANISYLKSKK